MTTQLADTSAYERSEQAEQDEFLGRIARSVHTAENDITEKWLHPNQQIALLAALGYEPSDHIRSISAHENEGILVVREVVSGDIPNLTVKLVTDWIYWDFTTPVA